MQRYLVIDLEATCDSPNNFPREQTEIIEIGAVVAREDGTIERELCTFVKPRIHPVTAFCTELTTIRPEDVQGAPSFEEAVEQVRRFAGDDSLVFASWGAYDRNQFRRQARRCGLRLPGVLATGHVNLKERFQEVERGRRRGLGSAIRRCGLQFDGTAHRGIDDARNIARLLPFCLGAQPLPTDR